MVIAESLKLEALTSPTMSNFGKRRGLFFQHSNVSNPAFSKTRSPDFHRKLRLRDDSGLSNLVANDGQVLTPLCRQSALKRDSSRSGVSADRYSPLLRKRYLNSSANRLSLQLEDAKCLTPCGYDWTVDRVDENSGTRVRVYGSGDATSADRYADDVLRIDAISREMEEAFSKKTVPMESIRLPVELESMSRDLRLAHKLEARELQLEACSSCPVVIKEVIPGKRVPCISSFFGDKAYLLRTSRFQHPLCDSPLPVDARPELVTADDLEQQRMISEVSGVPEALEISELLHAAIKDDIMDRTGLRSATRPVTLYPDLINMTLSERIQPGPILSGERFDISGDVLQPEIKPNDRKRKVRDPRGGSVTFGKTTVALNQWVPDKLPKGKFETPKGKVWVERDHASGLSIAILYTTAILAIRTPVISDLPIGFLCGDDKHGVLWSLPPEPDGVPHKESGDSFVGRVFTKKPTYPLSSYICYEEVVTDVTILGFFGTKNHLDHRERRVSVDVDVCKSWAAGKTTNLGKLAPVAEGVWRTNIPHKVDYSYCCTSDTYSTTNYVLRMMNITVHTGATSDVMVSGDFDFHDCNRTVGSCVTKDRTAIWEADDKRGYLEAAGEAKFDRLIDGSVFSKELQLALEVLAITKQACGYSMSETAQGVYLYHVKPLNSTRHRARDIDVAERTI